MSVAVFIDYDNVSICLEKYYELHNDETRQDLKTKLIEKIKDIYKDDMIVVFKAFADFEKIKTTLTILQKNQIELRHVYSSNQRKNASDIALTVNVIKSLYSKNNIDKYILISSDSDMLPIINEIRYFGKDVTVIFSNYNSVADYESYLQKFLIIENLLEVRKYVPIDAKQEVEQKLNHYINLINKGIYSIYTKHSNTGTSNKTNLSEYIFVNSKFTRNDALLIIEYLLRERFLSESLVKSSNYKKILINMSRIKEYNETAKEKISIEDKILSEKNF